MSERRSKPQAELIIIGGRKTRTILIKASTSERAIYNQLKPGEHIAYGRMIRDAPT